MERSRKRAFNEWRLPEDRRRALAAMAILIPIVLGFFVVDLSRFGGSPELLPWMLARGATLLGWVGVLVAARRARSRRTLFTVAALAMAAFAVYSTVRHFTSTSGDLAHHATDTFLIVLVYFIPTWLAVQVAAGLAISGSALGGLLLGAGPAGALSTPLVAAHLSANAVGLVIAVHLARAARLRFDAEEEVKELREILPMCARCKSVRDDSGFWQKVESYISQREEVGVTHGLCPVCMEELYGKEVADRVARVLQPGEDVPPS